MPSNVPLKRKKAVEEVEEDYEMQEENIDEDEEGSCRVEGIYIPPPPRKQSNLNNDGQRLIITSINNYFFKSYAGQQLLGPFHKCFNAIIGPNGSGKSNVIDAMLFVFGYRASKIRSKKISVLLHNSEHYPNIQSCTVSVNFAVIVDKDGDDYDIVPDSEFVISRTAHKDNSSYYQINAHRVQFKEVAKLLRSHGIDLDHNRFLILQGEVEQIAMMKCKAQTEHETGMLEYLEDIIGTARYKVPLLKLDEKLEIVDDQRNEKLNRVKLVEKEMNELQQPMEEAIAFLKLENLVTSNYNFIYQWQIHNLEEKIKKIETEKIEFVEAQNDLMSKLTALGEEKKAKDEELKEATVKHDKLQKRREKIKEAFNVANNQDIQLQAEMTQTNKTRKNTKELLMEEQKKLSELQNVPENNEKDIAECEAKQLELQEKKEKLETEKNKLLSSLKNETQDLQQQKETVQIELAELNKVVDQTKSAYTLAESELKIYVSNEENEKTKFENLQSNYESIKTTLIERSQELVELKNKIPLTEKSLKTVQEDLQNVKLKEAKVINEIRTRRTFLTEAKSEMQATRSRGKVLDCLLQQKGEGKCPGLFGRLGDLGAIDQKYDVAISTACGPLDNIVVDTVETAQWCIEFLKKHDIGRAVFIALEKQEYLRQRANSQIQTPENVPRLYDLIKINDDRVRTAFYYALRDTLVAKDLDQASRIAYGEQRYRVVTLGGQIIETTGTMSGGGKTVSRGRMGQSIQTSSTEKKDIQNTEKELQTLEETISELRQKQTVFENQLHVLEPELIQMKSYLEKYIIELKSSKQQEPILLQQLKVQEVKAKNTKVNPTILNNLKDVVNKTKIKYDKASDAAGNVQVVVNKLTAQIEEKTVGKMKSLDKNLKDAINQIAKCKTEITRLTVGIKTAERNAKKSSEKIKTLEIQITEAENSLRKMKNQRDEIETDGKQLLNSMENITSELTDAEEIFTKTKNEVGEINKQENKLKSEKIEIDQKCKVFNKKIDEQKGEVHQWRCKLVKLKFQDIPNQELEVLKTFSPEELKQKDIKGVQHELHCHETQLKSAKPDFNTINEYRKKREVFIQRSKELDELSNQKGRIKDALELVRQKRKEEFVTGFNIIKLKLKEMYQMITLGGDADFEMVDTFDPFTEGIQFNVRPPKKSWKCISNLSGGEKTLSSLALVFALHYYKPSPLYVMDEIDAALDFKNVSIVGNYIKERTKNAQFIIISLRSNMFELCDYLIGIYKTFSCTKSICIDPRRYDNQQSNNSVNNNMANPNNLFAIGDAENRSNENNQLNNDNVYVDNSDSDSDSDTSSLSSISPHSSDSESVIISSLSDGGSKHEEMETN